MGPNYAVWWDDGDGLPTPLALPVVDAITGELATLRVDAWKVACGDYWDLNTGQSSDWGCTHQVVLAVSEENDHLTSGREYRSPGSSPLVVDGRKWHEPEAGLVQATYAFEIVYTAP